MRFISVRRLFRTVIAVLACQAVLPVILPAQDAASGLGRVFVYPMPQSLDLLIAGKLIKTRMPLQVVPSIRNADCVVGLMPEKDNPKGTLSSENKEGPKKFVMIDIQSRTIVWQLDTDSSKENVLRKIRDKIQPQDTNRLAAQVVSKMKHDGAYCGGSPFSAPTRNMEDRIKAFRPPTFNW